ncbi:hypothetical protein BMS3Abin15_00365 [bacterium BMS3Abin15]|nr:hypothetical protein BMS3Abin15_00365 [bacterium BMS3Abin15]HDZ85727.1 DUF389 domain-containing protein [Candidatus Moranbacteria bacterium]
MSDKNKACKTDNILDVTKSEQYRTVEELFDNCQANPVYYTLLILSSLIIACGLLLVNPIIIIGGILVTPFLTPILVIALSISVGEMKAMRSLSFLVLKSAFIIIAVSFVLALLFGTQPDSLIFGDSLRVAILYFVVAVTSGVAATFAWTRKEVADVLPGLAIAVSLVPPLSALGIGLSNFDFYISRLAFLTFTFNLIGVILGSLVVFSILKFHKSEQVIHKEAVEQEKESEKKQ